MPRWGMSWREFAHRSTIHAVFEILTSPNKWFAAFWVTTLILAVGMAAFEFSQTVQHYIRRPLGISITPLDFGRMKLPDILLCPFGRFNNTYIDNEGLPSELMDYVDRAFGGVSPDYYGFNKTDEGNKTQNVALEDLLSQTLKKMQLSFAHFIDKATINCKGMVEYCRSPMSRYDCCESSIPELTMSGKCHRVQGIVQNAPGFGAGMTIRVNLPSHLYYHSANIMHDQGIAIILVEAGTQRRNAPIILRRGIHALINVKLNEFVFMHDPPREYSNLACFDHCFFANAFQHCNCSTILSAPDSVNPCTPGQFDNCINPYLTMLFDADPQMVSRCRNSCPPSCEYKEYQSSVSYTNFPSPSIKRIMPNVDLDSLKNTIIIDMFYERMEIVRYSHHATMTPDGFIATMGGQLNLWIGASIVSAIQLVAFFGQKVTEKSSDACCKKSEIGQN